MSFWHIVLPVLVGGIIGYCTNYIAIKMLFRPHKAIYIGKFKLPFTPGIIPKNQKRVARAVGDAVSEQLLTKDAVMESVGETAEHYISGIAAAICNTDKSIAQILPKDADGDAIADSVSAAVTDGILKKAQQVDFESVIGKFGQEAIGSFLNSNPMLSMLFNADMQRMICAKLSNALRNYIDTHGEDVIKGCVSDYVRELTEQPAGELITRIEDKDRLQKAIENALRNAVEQHGADLLEKVDVKGIVTQRIEEMDMTELEELVLSVMKQELQAVINLGAAIGALIGIINIFL